jgi:protein TonB
MMRRTRGQLEAIVIGTLAAHVAILLALDIAGTWARHHPPQIVEVIELDDAPPPPEVKIPLPKLPDLAPPKLPEPTQPAQPVHRTQPAHVTQAPPAREPPTPQVPTTTDPPTPGGGDEAYKLPEGPTGGVAIPVARGHGGGGTGGGTGGGSGAAVGSGSAPAPVSIAAIKQKAMPRGDYSYFGAGADYPAEARQLGIEGTIRVRLVVDAHGKVISRTLLNKLGHGLDELAMARAAAIEFDPALDENDQPVTSIVVWTFDFQLPK